MAARPTRAGPCNVASRDAPLSNGRSRARSPSQSVLLNPNLRKGWKLWILDSLHAFLCFHLNFYLYHADWFGLRIISSFELCESIGCAEFLSMKKLWLSVPVYSLFCAVVWSPWVIFGIICETEHSLSEHLGRLNSLCRLCGERQQLFLHNIPKDSSNRCSSAFVKFGILDPFRDEEITHSKFVCTKCSRPFFFYLFFYLSLSLSLSLCLSIHLK